MLAAIVGTALLDQFADRTADNPALGTVGLCDGLRPGFEANRSSLAFEDGPGGAVGHAMLIALLNYLSHWDLLRGSSTRISKSKPSKSLCPRSR